MSRNSTAQFEIPSEMRAFAEKSVEQARQAFEGFVFAANRTASAIDGQAETTRKRAQDLGQRVLAFAEQNIKSSFEFARKLVRSRDVDEMLKLQADYIKTQMATLAEQAKELGESTSKTAKDVGKSKH